MLRAVERAPEDTYLDRVILYRTFGTLAHGADHPFGYPDRHVLFHIRRKLGRSTRLFSLALQMGGRGFLQRRKISSDQSTCLSRFSPRGH